MRQNVALSLHIQHIPIVCRAVDGLNPGARRIDYLNPYGSSCPAAHDQHRRKAYG